ncbi:unnamed protein product [Diatraea saccharalis]|uniref:Uncharacterized protein n=1 Tax=Diatraea saccharalis TaxID=40085 RepID=A0A9N9WCR6_9NEOP|nr:unnamed protein product [Diatraea saccharalis]
MHSFCGLQQNFRLHRDLGCSGIPAAMPSRLMSKIYVDILSKIYVELRLGRDDSEREISKKVQLGWAAFRKLPNIFSSTLPQCLKTQVFNQSVLPVRIYGA